jgi:hypothetical protein
MQAQPRDVLDCAGWTALWIGASDALNACSFCVDVRLTKPSRAYGTAVSGLGRTGATSIAKVIRMCLENAGQSVLVR